MVQKVVAAPGKRSAPAARKSRVSTEDIRRRAYEIFLARGGGHGHDVEDWLKAEKELKAKK